MKVQPWLLSLCRPMSAITANDKHARTNYTRDPDEGKAARRLFHIAIGRRGGRQAQRQEDNPTGAAGPNGIGEKQVLATMPEVKRV